MTADSIEELNTFALKIGLKTSWLQISNKELPHYDLVESKRKLAVKYGAMELNLTEAGERYEQYFKSLKTEL